MSVGDVFSTISSYLGSTYINQFNKFGQSYQVYAQANSQFRLQPEDILNLFVRNSDQQMVPMRSVAYLNHEVAPPLITLYNLFPSATIVGAAAQGFSSGQAIDSMEQIAKTTLPSDVSYQWSGMSYQEKLVGNRLVYIFALSIPPRLSRARGAIWKLDPAARSALRRAADLARARRRLDQPRRR